jgi:uncharacterized protein YlaN (UPF0358 family)
MVVLLPHVVLNGEVEIENIFRNIEPLFIKNENEILKIIKIYMDQLKKSILFESLAIEKGKKTQFFGMLSKREDGLVVRIYPGFEIEKTDGVKRILAEIAKNLIEKFPRLKIGETNLSDFLN